jgi:hypothetical protein
MSHDPQANDLALATTVPTAELERCEELAADVRSSAFEEAGAE